MSGGDAVSPFTTPEAACGSGLAAGNTDPSSFAAFGDQPEVPGQQYTVDSDVGLYSRSAIRTIGLLGMPVRTRPLTTLGTPWMGTFPLRWAFGEIPDSALMGQEFTTKFATEFKTGVGEGDLGLAQENTYHYLVGERRWNDFQIGALDDTPVYTVGGTYFEADGGDPELWPNDGLVTRFSALAEGLPPQVAPRHTSASFAVTHSIFIADLIKQPWETGMTWNPEVLASVEDFLVSL